MGFGWLFDNGFDINKAINHFDLSGYSKLRYFFLPTIIATRFQTKKIPGDRLFKINFSPDLFAFSLLLPVGVQEFWLTQTFIDREQRKVARTLALEWLKKDVIEEEELMQKKRGEVIQALTQQYLSAENVLNRDSAK